MKITFFQLENQLSKKLPNVFLISGDEWLLKQDAVNAIVAVAKQNNFEHSRLLYDAPQFCEQFFSLMHANSLFAEKCLLEIEFRDHHPNKETAKLLVEYLAAPNPHITILLVTAKIDSKTMKSAWYQAIDKQGIILPLWPVTRQQFPQWLINRAKQYSFRLAADAIKLISNFSEGNLIAAAGILEKIYLHQPQTVVTAELIQDFFKDESRFSIFDFAEHLLESDKAHLLKMLHQMEQEGIEPVLILWSILRELRMITEIAQQMQQGLSFASACEKFRVYNKNQPKLRAFLNKTNIDECLLKWQRATEIDRFIKGAARGDVWNVMSMFVLTL